MDRGYGITMGNGLVNAWLRMRSELSMDCLTIEDLTTDDGGLYRAVVLMQDGMPVGNASAMVLVRERAPTVTMRTQVLKLTDQYCTVRVTCRVNDLPAHGKATVFMGNWHGGRTVHVSASHYTNTEDRIHGADAPAGAAPQDLVLESTLCVLRAGDPSHMDDVRCVVRSTDAAVNLTVDESVSVRSACGIPTRCSCESGDAPRRPRPNQPIPPRIGRRPVQAPPVARPPPPPASTPAAPSDRQEHHQPSTPLVCPAPAPASLLRIAIVCAVMLAGVLLCSIALCLTQFCPRICEALSGRNYPGRPVGDAYALTRSEEAYVGAAVPYLG
uniref:W2R n=4 Tax=Squirrelpox virus TaxID=240426 RepID=Q1HTP3_9POXV|nr:W2R [Squirrelpox virus]